MQLKVEHQDTSSKSFDHLQLTCFTFEELVPNSEKTNKSIWQKH